MKTSAKHVNLRLRAVPLAAKVGLMGLAASFVARLLHRHRWIAFVGLAIIFYIALKMIFDTKPTPEAKASAAPPRDAASAVTRTSPHKNGGI